MTYDDPKFLEMYRAGKTNREIAAVFGINSTSVSKYVKRAIDKGMLVAKSERFTPEDDAVIVSMFNDGKSQRQMAEALGRSRAGISNRVAKLGLSEKKKVTWTPERTAILLKMIKNSTYDQIAKATGVSRNNVASKAGRMGLKRPTLETNFTAEDQAFVMENYQDMSMIDIAKHLGRTSGWMSDKFKKLGISPSGKRRVLVRRYVKPKPVTPSYVTPKVPVQIVTETPPDTARPWLTRLRGECSYPYGERHNIHSCCAPVWLGTGMCEAHAALCGGYVKVAVAA